MSDSRQYAGQSTYLGVLAAATAGEVKTLIDGLLPALNDVEVLANRTGLVMLPYTDTVQGTPFFLGEVLVSEAHVRVGGQEGYGACLGRDLEQALAIALADAVLQSHPPLPQRAVILRFVAEQDVAQRAAEVTLQQKVEATRIELETF